MSGTTEVSMNEIERRRSAVERVLGGSPLGVLIRLVITSLVVGIILRASGVDAADLVRWIEARIQDLSNLGLGTLEQIAQIILLGAVVVVPVWLILRVIRIMSR
jgi:hypothetical protein